MVYSLLMIPVATYEKRIRASFELTSDAKLALISILDLDDVRQDAGSVRPLDVAVGLVASGCGLNDTRTLLAMRELERLRLVSVEHIGGMLDLRLTVHHEAIESLLSGSRAIGSGGRGPSGGGGARGRIRRADPAKVRLRGTGSDGEVRIVPVDYQRQTTSPDVDSQHARHEAA